MEQDVMLQWAMFKCDKQRVRQKIRERPEGVKPLYDFRSGPPEGRPLARTLPPTVAHLARFRKKADNILRGKVAGIVMVIYGT
jgi:hypothetical protein